MPSLKTALGHRAEISTDLISTVLKRVSLFFPLCVYFKNNPYIHYITLFLILFGKTERSFALNSRKPSKNQKEWLSWKEAMISLLTQLTYGMYSNKSFFNWVFGASEPSVYGGMNIYDGKCIVHTNISRRILGLDRQYWTNLKFQRRISSRRGVSYRRFNRYI